MERNEKVFRTHRALSWLYGASGVLIFLLVASTGNKANADFAFFMLLLFGFFFWLHRKVAQGALAREPWARTASIVIGLLMLTGFPIGTLIGLYLLYNAWSEWPAPESAAQQGSAGSAR